jgi:putative tryptophan/tyrosine transport system substrate-binding protein
VIVTTGSPAAALAAKAATTTIPVVFGVPEDPVRSGLVASLARPGGNATGINFFSIEVIAKRLEILREMVSATARIAVLINPADAAAETMLKDVEAATRAMGLQIQVLKANTSHEIDAAFVCARATRCAFGQWGSLFAKPTCPISSPGRALRRPRLIWSA